MKNIFLFFILCLPFLGFAQKSYKKSIREHRKEYKSDFLKSERSPFYNKKADLKFIRFFRPKKRYKVEATFEATPDEKVFEMATYSGMVKPYRKYGVLKFKLNGKEQQLAVYQSMKMINVPGYKNYLFLPFKDLTNDRKTYGGGRYINLKSSEIKDGKMMLDFNKNYNPYCAFSDGYNCPIPPGENHLEVAIKAGERKFAKAH